MRGAGGVTLSAACQLMKYNLLAGSHESFSCFSEAITL